jgi:hypothetical protein
MNASETVQIEVEDLEKITHSTHVCPLNIYGKQHKFVLKVSMVL